MVSMIISYKQNKNKNKKPKKPKKLLLYYFLTNQTIGKNKGKAEIVLKSNSFLKTQMPNTQIR